MRQVSIEEAVAAVMDVAPTPRMEMLGAEEGLGRTLAADLAAVVDHPPAHVSAMDGYACRTADTRDAGPSSPRRLLVIGEAAAGASFTGAVGPGEAVAISTGAEVPPDCDGVVPVEEVTRDLDAILLFGPASGRHVRRRGEDLLRSQVYLRAGEVLHPFQLGGVAALGHARLPLTRPPTVAVMPTGRELAHPGTPTARSTVFDSNGPLLAALLRSMGARPELHSPIGDREEEVIAAWRSAAHADLIVTSGGASVGPHDAVRGLLEAEGRLIFGGIQVRPGGPAMLGRWGESTILALPGTPVAAALLATILLGAWCHLALGRRGEPPYRQGGMAVAANPVPGHPEKSCLWLARAGRDETGGRTLSLVQPQGSARIAALLLADSLIVMPPGSGAHAGSTVRTVPLPTAVGGLLGRPQESRSTIRSGPE